MYLQWILFLQYLQLSKLGLYDPSSFTASYTAGDITSFINKLWSSDKKTTAMDEMMSNQFLSLAGDDFSAMQGFIYDAYKNRLLEQSDLHEVSSQLIELSEAILITRDAIISSDVVEGRMSRTLSFDNVNEDDEKNYIHSIKAWERIYKKVPDWRLDIYGDGEQKDLLHDYIKSNKILNIHIHDSTPNIADIYSKANFFLMSSKNEGLPMVLIESQSFGLPIISYDCPHGPRNIIENGVNGFLVENQNIEKLSEAMFILISNKKLQEKMSENSLINAKKYEPKEIINTWVNKVFKVEVD